MSIRGPPVRFMTARTSLIQTAHCAALRVIKPVALKCFRHESERMKFRNPWVVTYYVIRETTKQHSIKLVQSNL
jgi:hypothetical protein